MRNMKLSSLISGMKRILLAHYVDRQAFLLSLSFLNLFALALWAFWGIHFSLFRDMSELLRGNHDSLTYDAVCDWIYGQGSVTPHTLHRTFLYPLVLGIKFIAGDFGIWLLQGILLLTSVNLFALTIRNLTKRRVLVQAAFLVMAVYPTFFFMTFQIMTETLTVFLLTCWLYLSVCALKKNKLSDSSIFLLLLMAGLLSVTKPVFLPFHIFICLGALISKSGLRRLPLIILTFLPFACQLGINQHLHNRFVFSQKGSSAIRYSFLPKLLFQIRQNDNCCGQKNTPHFGHSEKDSINREINAWSARKRTALLLSHWSQTVKLFFLNVVQENMMQGFGVASPCFYYGTKMFNICALALHFCMLPFLIFIFIGQIGPPANRIWLMLHVFLFLLLVLTTGTVYWQQERYVFILIPLWITMYTIAFFTIREKVIAIIRFSHVTENF